MKYYLAFENGLMHCKEYDEANGIRRLGCGTKSRTALYHGAVIVEELFDSAAAAVKSLGGYSKEVKMPDGRLEKPCDLNYPKMASPFVPWNPSVKEIWPGEDMTDEGLGNEI